MIILIIIKKKMACLSGKFKTRKQTLVLMKRQNINEYFYAIRELITIQI